MSNNNIVNLTTIHKYLGIILDSKLSLKEDWRSVLKKISKSIGLLQKFQSIFLRTCFLTSYKSFAWPHLHYGDIIYDQTNIKWILPSNDWIYIL